MMAEMLIDSTVFEDFRQGSPGARAIIERVLDGSTTASVSPVTVFELWRSSDMDRQTEMGCVGMLSFMEPAPLSGEAAKVAGRWIASLDEADRTRLTPLALVAATAIERGEPICTREPESFRVFGVEAVRY